MVDQDMFIHLHDVCYSGQQGRQESWSIKRLPSRSSPKRRTRQLFNFFIHITHIPPLLNLGLKIFLFQFILSVSSFSGFTRCF